MSLHFLGCYVVSSLLICPAFLTLPPEINFHLLFNSSPSQPFEISRERSWAFCITFSGTTKCKPGLNQHMNPLTPSLFFWNGRQSGVDK